jgi:hypothetical protein
MLWQVEFYGPESIDASHYSSLLKWHCDQLSSEQLLGRLVLEVFLRYEDKD